jgi:hypothetical protein
MSEPGTPAPADEPTEAVSAGATEAAGSAGVEGVEAAGAAAGATEAAANHLDGEVVNIKLLGSIVRLVVTVGSRELSVDGFNDPGRTLSGIGEKVRLRVEGGSIMVAGAEAAPAVAALRDEEA